MMFWRVERIGEHTTMLESVEWPEVDYTCTSALCYITEKESYYLPVECYNCGFKGRGEFTKQHETGYDLLCPHCQTRKVHARRTWKGFNV